MDLLILMWVSGFFCGLLGPAFVSDLLKRRRDAEAEQARQRQIEVDRRIYESLYAKADEARQRQKLAEIEGRQRERR